MTRKTTPSTTATIGIAMNSARVLIAPNPTGSQRTAASSSSYEMAKNGYSTTMTPAPTCRSTSSATSDPMSLARRPWWWEPVPPSLS
jgi:hypothetical protein